MEESLGLWFWVWGNIKDYKGILMVILYPITLLPRTGHSNDHDDVGRLGRR